MRRGCVSWILGRLGEDLGGAAARGGILTNPARPDKPKPLRKNGSVVDLGLMGGFLETGQGESMAFWGMEVLCTMIEYSFMRGCACTESIVGLPGGCVIVT